MLRSPTTKFILLTLSSFQISFGVETRFIKSFDNLLKDINESEQFGFYLTKTTQQLFKATFDPETSGAMLYFIKLSRQDRANSCYPADTNNFPIENFYYCGDEKIAIGAKLKLEKKEPLGEEDFEKIYVWHGSYKHGKKILSVTNGLWADEKGRTIGAESLNIANLTFQLPTNEGVYENEQKDSEGCKLRFALIDGFWSQVAADPLYLDNRKATLWQMVKEYDARMYGKYQGSDSHRINVYIITKGQVHGGYQGDVYGEMFIYDGDSIYFILQKIETLSEMLDLWQGKFKQIIYDRRNAATQRLTKLGFIDTTKP